MPRECRTLTRAEVDTAIAWAAREGWNPGLHDAATFHAADPGAFFGAFVDDALTAVVSVAELAPRQGFLGFYICAPDRRGEGHGWAVWQAGLARLPDAVIGLDGVPDQQENYRRSGFAFHHRNIRYAGPLSPSAGASPPEGIEIVENAAAEALGAYDTACTGHPRHRYHAAWLAQPEVTCRIALQNGKVVGYALRRPCRDGAKIGPLMADTPAIAEALFQAVTTGNETPVGPVSIDLPEPNAEARALAQRHGLTPVFETARMYLGPPPALDLARTYSVTSFEFG